VIRLNDPERVRRQYETEAGLAVRRDAQLRFREGPDAFDTAFEGVAEAEPRRVLEVGCGMGNFSERIARQTSAAVVAVDISPRMVELAREHGVDARVGDVQALPFEDAEFDCAVANAMLYHVENVEQALAELARVLEPGGRLVATTVGRKHMHELWTLVGFRLPERPFSRENGEAQLARHFARVDRRDVDAALVFPDAASARRYVESSCFGDEVSRPLPDFEGPFRSRVCASVFVAER
jgi:SAM-dependent methyltransferase